MDDSFWAKNGRVTYAIIIHHFPKFLFTATQTRHGEHKGVSPMGRLGRSSWFFKVLRGLGQGSYSKVWLLLASGDTRIFQRTDRFDFDFDRISMLEE
jgi:hypothetical protein